MLQDTGWSHSKDLATPNVQLAKAERPSFSPIPRFLLKRCGVGLSLGMKSSSPGGAKPCFQGGGRTERPAGQCAAGTGAGGAREEAGKPALILGPGVPRAFHLNLLGKFLFQCPDEGRVVTALANCASSSYITSSNEHGARESNCVTTLTSLSLSPPSGEQAL